MPKGMFFQKNIPVPGESTLLQHSGDPLCVLGSKEEAHKLALT